MIQSEIEQEISIEPEEESEAYMTYDIATYPSDLTISGIHEMWHNDEIIIPDFQRNFVWTIRQSSLLIESFLMGLPVPQLFMYIDDDGKSHVIDGLQRVMSVVYFRDGFFGEENLHGKKQIFRLTGLSDNSPFANKTYDELEEKDKRKLLRNSIIRAINIKQLQPKENPTSIYHIFERLNTGGTPLTPQEIRNCVFRGLLVERLRGLNQVESWRAILGKRTLDRHQKDVELILRLLAFFTRYHAYEKPMKEFLNVTMMLERNAASALVLRFIELFPKVCSWLVAEFGDRPFHLKGRLNASALDSVFCSVLHHFDELPNDLKHRYELLKHDSEFLQATYYSTSDLAVIRKRFERVNAILFNEA